MNADVKSCKPTLFVFFLNDSFTLLLSLQRVLGLDSFDGVLNPTHVSGKHIVHNVFSVNKSGIVVLENKAGVSCSNRETVHLSSGRMS